jgi:hypothetical protein
MKHLNWKMMLPCAAALVALPMAGYGQNASADGNGTDAGTNAAQIAQSMTPANARLTHTLDAKKDRIGSPVTAKLMGKVHLKNGTEFPKNTEIEGQVVQDELNLPGATKLAVRFDKAKLPSGQVVPIKAMLVGVSAPMSAPEGGTMSVDNMPNNWNPSIQQVDELSVMSGVDLHSRLTGENSGVFVAKSKHDVKIPTEDEIQMAVTPTGRAQSQGTASQGGLQ